jgi:glutamate/tyrosine decarboxylase-like PLP-dependent enzyme
MHHLTHETEQLAEYVFRYVNSRISGKKNVGTTNNSNPETLRQELSITENGVGAQQTFKKYCDYVDRNIVATDHPRYLAYVPNAQTPTSVLADTLITASGAIGSGWVDGAGAIAAENAALAWLADQFGLDPNAGGCFVSGGTVGNLSALYVARQSRSIARSAQYIICADTAHTSITLASKILGLDILPVKTDPKGRLQPRNLRHVIEEANRDRIAAVVATGGNTTTGAVDDLARIGKISRHYGCWLHIDAAYGGAAALSKSRHTLFQGLRDADSIIVDPHKWLFAPYDCCALLYKAPQKAKACFSSDAEYLKEVNSIDEWNPMDYGIHLTRKPRGIPFWFSLVSHGAKAYRDSVDDCIGLADHLARYANGLPNLSVPFQPELSIVLFKRNRWSRKTYKEWITTVTATYKWFIEPVEWRDKTYLRLCIINPLLNARDAEDLLDSLNAAGERDGLNSRGVI